MPDYHVAFHWDHSHPTPVLLVRISGSVRTDIYALASILDEAQARADAAGHDAVHLAFDVSNLHDRLRLADLMRSSAQSSRVRRAALIGARTRRDEMSVLIMSAARRLPYEFTCFPTLADAAPYLYA